MVVQQVDFGWPTGLLEHRSQQFYGVRDSVIQAAVPLGYLERLPLACLRLSIELLGPPRPPFDVAAALAVAVASLLL
jgi:hypothetical protein